MCDDASGFAAADAEQSLEEPHCCLSISAILSEHIHYFTVLIDGAPKIVLYALNLHEDLIEEEGITVTLVSAAKSLGVLRNEFDIPQSNELVADRDSALGHEIFDITSTQMKAVIEPDNVLDDFSRKPVTLVHGGTIIHPSLSLRIS